MHVHRTRRVQAEHGKPASEEITAATSAVSALAHCTSMATPLRSCARKRGVTGDHDGIGALCAAAEAGASSLTGANAAGNFVYACAGRLPISGRRRGPGAFREPEAHCPRRCANCSRPRPTRWIPKAAVMTPAAGAPGTATGALSTAACRARGAGPQKRPIVGARLDLPGMRRDPRTAIHEPPRYGAGFLSEATKACLFRVSLSRSGRLIRMQR